MGKYTYINATAIASVTRNAYVTIDVIADSLSDVSSNFKSMSSNAINNFYQAIDRIQKDMGLEGSVGRLDRRITHLNQIANVIVEWQNIEDQITYLQPYLYKWVDSYTDVTDSEGNVHTIVTQQQVIDYEIQGRINVLQSQLKTLEESIDEQLSIHY